MLFKTTVLVILVDNLLFSALGTPCIDDDVFHRCTSKNNSVFLIGDVAVSCLAGTVCNLNYLATTNKAGDIICEPCLEPTKACEGSPKYKCKDAKTFELYGLEFECSETYLCNMEQKHGCAPCYQEICAENAWICGPQPDDVTTESYKGKCTNGSVCKIEKYGPCDEPCIAKTKLGLITLSTNAALTAHGTVIPTTPTHLPTTTTSTTTLSAVTTSKTTVDSSPTEIPPTIVSTAVSTSPTICVETPFKVPNCNDGHGDTKPCRPGPGNKVYYYKCKYSPLWYDYEIRLCSNLKQDPLCNGKVC